MAAKVKTVNSVSGRPPKLASKPSLSSSQAGGAKGRSTPRTGKSPAKPKLRRQDEAREGRKDGSSKKELMRAMAVVEGLQKQLGDEGEKQIQMANQLKKEQKKAKLMCEIIREQKMLLAEETSDTPSSSEYGVGNAQSTDERQEDLSKGLEKLQLEIEQRDELIQELQNVSGVFTADAKELRKSVESTADALGEQGAQAIEIRKDMENLRGVIEESLQNMRRMEAARDLKWNDQQKARDETIMNKMKEIELRALNAEQELHGVASGMDALDAQITAAHKAVVSQLLPTVLPSRSQNLDTALPGLPSSSNLVDKDLPGAGQFAQVGNMATVTLGHEQTGSMGNSHDELRYTENNTGESLGELEADCHTKLVEAKKKAVMAQQNEEKLREKLKASQEHVEMLEKMLEHQTKKMKVEGLYSASTKAWITQLPSLVNQNSIGAHQACQALQTLQMENDKLRDSLTEVVARETKLSHQISELTTQSDLLNHYANRAQLELGKADASSDKWKTIAESNEAEVQRLKTALDSTEKRLRGFKESVQLAQGNKTIPLPQDAELEVLQQHLNIVAERAHKKGREAIELRNKNGCLSGELKAVRAQMKFLEKELEGKQEHCTY